MVEWLPGRVGEWTYRDRVPGNGRPDGGTGLQVDVGLADGRAWWLLAEYDASGHACDVDGGTEATVAAAKTAGMVALEEWRNG